MTIRSKIVKYRGVLPYAVAMVVFSVLTGEPARSLDTRDAQLFAASEGGNTSEAISLLRRGANIEARNDTGMTPLMRAAEFGHLDTMKVLVERGANIHARDSIVGFTAVTTGCDAGQASPVGYLLDHGGDPNTPDKNGITPLMWAAAYGNVATVRTLVIHHAHLDAQDRQGKTALMIAAGDQDELTKAPGNAESVRLLIKAGADPSIVDKHGRTARDIAVQYRNVPVIEALDRTVSRR